MNLKNAISTLSKIQHLNLGGCGVSALALYRLMKGNNAEIRFLYRNFGDQGLENNRKALAGDWLNPEAPDHVMLFVNGRYLDSNGYAKRSIIDTIFMFKLIVPEDFLVRAVNNREKWSDKFSRENVDVIEKSLNVNLSDIK